MSEEHASELGRELQEFTSLLQWARSEVIDVVIEELKLAQDVAATDEARKLNMGVGDLLPKIDDLVWKLWDWWRGRKR